MRNVWVVLLKKSAEVQRERHVVIVIVVIVLVVTKSVENVSSKWDFLSWTYLKCNECLTLNVP